jgi:hypothetical protein
VCKSCRNGVSTFVLAFILTPAVVPNENLEDTAKGEWREEAHHDNDRTEFWV